MFAVKDSTTGEYLTHKSGFYATYDSFWLNDLSKAAIHKRKNSVTACFNDYNTLVDRSLKDGHCFAKRNLIMVEVNCIYVEV